MIRKTLLALALSLGLCNMSHAAEGLNANQMGDLILHGQMTGADGARYDVWVVPGYHGPLQEMAKGWSAAGKDLSEYANARLYEEIFDTSQSMLKFAGKTAIVEFALEGSADAWSDAFRAAGKRVDKRVFGWWFAYPWAFIEATGESAFRIIIGVPGGVLVAGLGTTVVPAVQFVWPAGKGLYHGVIKGTALPIVAMSWNTIIAPPMALTGSQPTAARADGFWMTRYAPAVKPDPEVEQIEAKLRQWRKGLVNAPELMEVKLAKQMLEKDFEQKRQQLRDEQNHQSKQLDERRITIILQKAQDSSSTLDINKAKLAEILQKNGKQHVIGILMGDGINAQQAEALLANIVTPAEVKTAPEKPAEQSDPARPKTDPLRRSLELIEK